MIPGGAQTLVPSPKPSGATVPVSLPVIDATAAAYGVVADAVVKMDGVLAAGSADVTSATGAFAVADIGKQVYVYVPDRTVQDAAMTNGDNTIASATAAFVAGDVGKACAVYGALGGNTLYGTIHAVTDATHAVLYDLANAVPLNATTNVSAKQLSIRTPPLVGTISLRNSATSITLSATSSYAGTGATIVYFTDNRAALVLAIASAIAAKKPLQLPPGNIGVHFTAGNPTLTLGSPIKIQGAGKQNTTIYWGPNVSPTQKSQSLFSWEKATAGIELCDMTLHGPDDPGVPKGAAYVGSSWTGVNGIHLTVSGNTVGTGWWTVRRVDFAGRAVGAIQVAGGSATALCSSIVQDCDVTAYWVQIGFFSDPDSVGLKLHVYNCTFHGAENCKADTGEDLYVHQNVDFLVQDCHFVDNPYYAIQHFGSANVAARYARYINNTFHPAVANGILCSNKGPSHIEGNWFYNGAGGGSILLRHSATIIGNHFKQIRTAGSLGGQAMSNVAMAAGDQATIIGNEFDLIDFSGIGQNGIVASGVNTLWIIADNVFRLTGVASGDGVIAITAQTSGVLKIRGNTFYGSGTLTHLTAISLGAGQVCDIDDNHFLGGYAAATGEACVVATGGVPGLTKLRRNTFSIPTTGRPLVIGDTSGSTYTKTFQLEGNEWTYPSGVPPLSRGTNVQHGRLKPGIAAAVASAATITPGINFDTFHITGTTTIDTITLGNDALCQNLFHGAKLYLIFDSTAATSAAGNIVPKTVAARVAGQVAELTYDAETNKYYEAA